MNKKINLQPLQEYLTMGIPPQELSEVLDELLFDYIRMVLYNTSQPEDDEGAYLHLETHNFIHHLKKLRDTFRQCGN